MPLWCERFRIRFHYSCRRRRRPPMSHDHLRILQVLGFQNLLHVMDISFKFHKSHFRNKREFILYRALFLSYTSIHVDEIALTGSDLVDLCFLQGGHSISHHSVDEHYPKNRLDVSTGCLGCPMGNRGNEPQTPKARSHVYSHLRHTPHGI